MVQSKIDRGLLLKTISVLNDKVIPDQETELKTALREMRDCENRNRILYDIIAENLGIKDKNPDELSLFQCQSFLREFMERDK